MKVLHRSRTLLFSVLLLLFAGDIQAGERFGAGFILGDPVGLSGKLWIGPNTAIAVAAAWSFRGATTLHLHGDYLRHHQVSGQLKEDRVNGAILLYYGIGGRILDRREDRVGMRLPFGLAYVPVRVPLDFYVEVVPLLDLVPGTEATLNMAAGIRYFF